MKYVFTSLICHRDVEIFKFFAKKNKIKFKEEFYIADSYTGMPDITILNNLLDKNTIFYTKDRAFHNLIISKKLTSYYLSDGKITGNFFIHNII